MQSNQRSRTTCAATTPFVKTFLITCSVYLLYLCLTDTGNTECPRHQQGQLAPIKHFQTKLTQDSNLVFPPRTSTLKKAFAWAPKSRGAPANSATPVASWLILGSYLYCHNVTWFAHSISASLHFLWSNILVISTSWNGMLQMMGKDLPDDFETSRNSLGGWWRMFFHFTQRYGSRTGLGFSMLKGLVLYNNGP